MKNSDFCPCGYCVVCNAGGYEIEIDKTGEAARFRLFGKKVTRWRKIQFTTSERAFVTLNRRREFLDNYLRY